MRSHAELAVLAAAFAAVAIAPPITAQPVESISPGGVEVVAPLPDTCPVFRWRPRSDVQRWRLTVHRLERDESAVVLTQRLPGRTTHWTPAVPDCLVEAGRYVWTLAAERLDGRSVSSKPRHFELTADALARSPIRHPEPTLAPATEIYSDDFEGGLCSWSGASASVDCSAAGLVVEIDPDFLSGAAGVPGCDSDGSIVTPFPVGLVVPLRVTAALASGGSVDVTGEAEWDVSAPEVGTVDADGLYRSLGAGVVEILATWGGAEGLIEINNAAVGLSSLDVTPDNGWQIPIGWRRRFEADGNFLDGRSCNLTRSAVWALDPSSRASVVGAGRIDATDDEALAGPLLVTATFGPHLDFTSGAVGGSCVRAVDVLQTGLSLPVGAESILGVEIVLSNGEVHPAPQGDVAWESTDPGSVSVTADPNLDGLATVAATALGSARVEASYVGTVACEGADPLVDSALVTTTPAEDQILFLTIQSPATLDIPLGWEEQLTVIAGYQFAGPVDVTDLATWGSTNDLVAMVDDDTEKGLVSTVATGDATVFAVLDGVVDTVAVTVLDACIESVTVLDGTLPGPLTVPMDVPLLIRVLAVFSSGTFGSLNPPAGDATLVSDAPSRVDAPALFFQGLGYTYTKPPGEGGSPGPVTLTATVDDAMGACPGYGTLTDDLEITVDSTTLDSVLVTPVDPSVPVGLSLPFTATGFYTPGNDAFDITRRASWSVDDEDVATIIDLLDSPNNGGATGEAEGTTTVTAMQGGVSGQTTLTVGPAVPVFLEVSCAVDPLTGGFGGEAPVGVQGQCSAQAFLSDGSMSDATALVDWSTVAAPTTVAVVSNVGVVTTLAEGTAEVVAMLGALTDSDTVTVNDASLTDVEIVDLAGGGPTLELEVGAMNAYQARGHFSDGMATAVYDVTALAAWGSSTPSVATVGDTTSDKGEVSALSVGSTTIEALHLGVPGEIELTVVAPP